MVQARLGQGVEHRPGCCGAAGGVDRLVQQHGDRQLWVRCRQEPGEDRGVAIAGAAVATPVVAAVEWVGFTRRAGLCGNRVPGDLPLRRSAIVDHLLQRRVHPPGHLGSDHAALLTRLGRLDLAVGTRRLLNQPRRDVHAFVGDHVVGRPQLDRGHRDALADGDRRQIRRVPALGGRQDAARLTGKSQWRGAAESKVTQCVLEPGCTQPLGQHHRADVGGLGHDVVHPPLLGRMPVVVGVFVIAHRQAPRHGEHLVRVGLPRFKRSGHRHQLHDRPGLVGGGEGHVVGHRADHICFLVAFDVGHGQQFAGAGVAHDRHAGLGTLLIDRRHQLAFSLKLQRLVQGQGQVGARHCRRAGACGVGDR